MCIRGVFICIPEKPENNAGATLVAGDAKEEDGILPPIPPTPTGAWVPSV